MKNKKGFTLIELLCVIALLAVVTTIASASVINLSNKSKENLYCAKLEIIESAAKTYSSSLIYELNNSTTYYDGYKSMTITINDLVENGNLSPDKNDTVLSPLDNTAMNDIKIILYLKNNQVYVAIEGNNIC